MWLWLFEIVWVIFWVVVGYTLCNSQTPALSPTQLIQANKRTFGFVVGGAVLGAGLIVLRHFSPDGMAWFFNDSGRGYATATTFIMSIAIGATLMSIGSKVAVKTGKFFVWAAVISVVLSVFVARERLWGAVKREYFPKTYHTATPTRTDTLRLKEGVFANAFSLPRGSKVTVVPVQAGKYVARLSSGEEIPFTGLNCPYFGHTTSLALMSSDKDAIFVVKYYKYDAELGSPCG